MKAMADLQATDFPGVDSVRFDAWKQASLEAQRKTWWVLPLMLAAIVAVFFLVQGFVGAALIIGVAGVGGMLISGPANRAAKEAGITRNMVRQARR
ncbi:MAG: hypothetical protein WEE36_10385 [Acidimicrobiia bacterium]